MVSALEADMAKNHRLSIPFGAGPMSLAVLADHQYINDQALRYYTVLRRLPLNVKKVQSYRDTAYEEFIEAFDRYDYVLTKSASNTAISAFQPSTDKMQSFFFSNADRFTCLMASPEPDGSTVSIFARKH